MKRYYSANDYFLKTFGEKTYKIALDGGMSCPNRTPDKKGGCIFCSAGGSGDFAQKPCDDVFEQIEGAINLVKAKKPTKFIAYFQSYTNTYAPIEYLSSLFSRAIAHPKVCALSIATRPDCLDDDVISLLETLNKTKPIFVELGLQSANDDTAKLINRGYPTTVYIDAVKRLKRAKINVITHLIIGLPNENEDDLLRSIRLVNECKSDGVKLQLLHVLKDTVLAKSYNDGKFIPLSKDEYLRLLALCINHLSPDIVIHRISGDGMKKILLAPLWSADKKRVLNDINAYFEKHDVKQGKFLTY